MTSLANARGTPEILALSARQALEQVRDQAMFLIDCQGCIASWSEGVGAILGWPEADWIGQPVHVAFTPEDVDAGVPETEMRRATLEGRADDDRWMRRRNGERFFALGFMTRMLDPQGRHIGFMKVLRDHTGARQLAQDMERLLGSERQAREWAESQAASLTAAIDSISDGVCIGDLNGIRRCNAPAHQMLGAASEQALRIPLAELIVQFHLRRQRDGPPLTLDELPFACAARGHAASMEMWATRRADGRDIFIRFAAAPIRVDGHVLGAVAVYSDLTERLQLDQTGRDLSRVESVLQERTTEWRALVDGVRDYAIFTLGTDGRITSWHPGAALLKGYSAEEAIGMTFESLFTEEDQRAGLPAHEMAVAAEAGEFKGEGKRRRKDGSTFDAAVVLTPLRSPHGELRGFLKLTQDITARKLLENDREQMLHQARVARHEAEQANHSKGEFLATISHELRTPLSAILGWANVLERGVFDATTLQHGLAAISRNARTQVQLIEDLLDMNRIESGQLRLDLQRIELGGVIAAAIDSALPAAAAKGIGLRTRFEASSGVVMGDTARLQQVVGNLLSNAIKFTPSGGHVSVALTQWGEQAQVAVVDTGQGIEPTFLARMFDRFQQQDATTTRRYGGLGLGLAIVRHLVHLHGGTVRAHSPGTGLGATFTVTLPLAAEAARPPLALLPAPADEPVRLDGVTVLLVDDEPDVRAVTARVLQEAGARVLVAASAGEGLALLRGQRPMVLLSDIGMAVVDGYELMRRVRALPADQGGLTPAAAFTAYTRVDDAQLALDVGYQMHLPKPVPPVALVRAVARLAGGGPVGGFGP